MTNYGFKGDISYVGGAHNIKAGMQLMQTRLDEKFNLGITDPLFNAVCVDQNGFRHASQNSKRVNTAIMGVVYVPRAFAHFDQFQAEVRRVAESLAPEVVEIISTLGDDWSGEPAAFFMVILADPATRRDQLLHNANHVSQVIEERVQPLEEWGVLPYFNFRSQSEQATLTQPNVA